MDIGYFRKHKIKHGLKAIDNIFNCPPYPPLLLDNADTIDLAFNIVAVENPLNIFDENAIRDVVDKIEAHLQIAGYTKQIDSKTITVDFAKYSPEWAISCNSVALLERTLTLKAGRILFDKKSFVCCNSGLTIYGCMCREYGKLMLELKGIKNPSEFEIDMSTVYCGLGSEFSIEDGTFVVFDPKTSGCILAPYYPHRISMSEYQYARSLCGN